jgi:hypothetical protein
MCSSCPKISIYSCVVKRNRVVTHVAEKKPTDLLAGHPEAPVHILNM